MFVSLHGCSHGGPAPPCLEMLNHLRDAEDVSAVKHGVDLQLYSDRNTV